MECWRSRDRIGASSSAAVLRMYAGISSGSVACVFSGFQQFMHDVLHYWDATFSHIRDAGKIFLRGH